MIYFFSEAARAEHLEHVAFYEHRRPGLGARYLSAFDGAMAQVCEHPERFAQHPAGIRRVRVLGFPFSILYRVISGEIEVLAVAHHSRRPDYWVSRR